MTPLLIHANVQINFNPSQENSQLISSNEMAGRFIQDVNNGHLTSSYPGLFECQCGESVDDAKERHDTESSCHCRTYPAAIWRAWLGPFLLPDVHIPLHLKPQRNAGEVIGVALIHLYQKEAMDYSVDHLEGLSGTKRILKTWPWSKLFIEFKVPRLDLPATRAPNLKPKKPSLNTLMQNLQM